MKHIYKTCFVEKDFEIRHYVVHKDDREFVVSIRIYSTIPSPHGYDYIYHDEEYCLDY